MYLRKFSATHLKNSGITSTHSLYQTLTHRVQTTSRASTRRSFYANLVNVYCATAECDAPWFVTVQHWQFQHIAPIEVDPNYRAESRLSLHFHHKYLSYCHLRYRGRRVTHDQSAYKKPQKQNAAMTIRNMNWMIIARKERTRRLSLNVTKASLRCEEDQTPSVGEFVDIPREHEAGDQREHIDPQNRGPSFCMGVNQWRFGWRRNAHYSRDISRRTGDRHISRMWLLWFVNLRRVIEEVITLNILNAKSNPF